MKDILIIAHFIRGTLEGRFEYLANKLVDESCNVELVTTDFSHEMKRIRKMDEFQQNEFKFKLTMLHEPGYPKNITLKRFYSHFIMGRSLKVYLKNREKPDLIYCSVPSLDVGKIAAEYAKENNIKFIIDIQDLWPESFKMVFDIPVISDILFFPMKRQVNYIYKAADEIVAVSQTYLNRALQVNRKCKCAESIFLGTELNFFDEIAKIKIDKPKEEVWLAYIGTLGHSYDIEIVIDALSVLKVEGIDNIKFVVIGDGPLKSKFQNYAQKQKVWAEFTGRLNYKEMVCILSSCDIAINPIRAGSAGSIINKVGDYAAAGLPVINTQECREYRDLIEKYEAGINCENGDASDVAAKLMLLVKKTVFREKMGKNNRKLAEEKFNRRETYRKIIEMIVR